jgi:hypothetical protein
MDECDKVSSLLECGKDNSPDAVSGLMDNLENAMMVIFSSFYKIILSIVTSSQLRWFFLQNMQFAQRMSNALLM